MALHMVDDPQDQQDDYSDNSGGGGGGGSIAEGCKKCQIDVV